MFYRSIEMAIKVWERKKTKLNSKIYDLNNAQLVNYRNMI